MNSKLQFAFVCVIVTVAKAFQSDGPPYGALIQAFGFNLAMIPFSMVFGGFVFSVFSSHAKLAAIEDRWRRYSVCLLIGYPILFLAAMLLIKR